MAMMSRSENDVGEDLVRQYLREIGSYELLTAADIETDVLQNRFRSRIGRDAMWILIRPQVGNSSVRRSAGGKSQ